MYFFIERKDEIDAISPAEAAEALWEEYQDSSEIEYMSDDDTVAYFAGQEDMNPRIMRGMLEVIKQASPQLIQAYVDAVPAERWHLNTQLRNAEHIPFAEITNLVDRMWDRLGQHNAADAEAVATLKETAALFPRNHWIDVHEDASNMFSCGLVEDAGDIHAMIYSDRAYTPDSNLSVMQASVYAHEAAHGVAFQRAHATRWVEGEDFFDNAIKIVASSPAHEFFATYVQGLMLDEMQQREEETDATKLADRDSYLQYLLGNVVVYSARAEFKQRVLDERSELRWKDYWLGDDGGADPLNIQYDFAKMAERFDDIWAEVAEEYGLNLLAEHGIALPDWRMMGSEHYSQFDAQSILSEAQYIPSAMAVLVAREQAREGQEVSAEGLLQAMNIGRGMGVRVGIDGTSRGGVMFSGLMGHMGIDIRTPEAWQKAIDVLHDNIQRLGRDIEDVPGFAGNAPKERPASTPLQRPHTETMPDANPGEGNEAGGSSPTSDGIGM